MPTGGKQGAKRRMIEMIQKKLQTQKRLWLQWGPYFHLLLLLFLTENWSGAVSTVKTNTCLSFLFLFSTCTLSRFPMLHRRSCYRDIFFSLSVVSRLWRREKFISVWHSRNASESSSSSVCSLFLCDPEVYFFSLLCRDHDACEHCNETHWDDYGHVAQATQWESGEHALTVSSSYN